MKTIFLDRGYSKIINYIENKFREKQRNSIYEYGEYCIENFSY
ncbi:hypothetical protein CNEO2_280014 [Clostridium neonatale]|nr:hypothetical protein CNEO2_280014 [Clostridium neonatale]CAI3247836.1 hypothetical protein CNEO2_50194 [Clostridium neonatale]CAI3558070.1 hypothetical protein CNEO4_280048 [Clostridium neonatale]